MHLVNTKAFVLYSLIFFLNLTCLWIKLLLLLFMPLPGDLFTLTYMLHIVLAYCLLWFYMNLFPGL